MDKQLDIRASKSRYDRYLRLDKLIEEKERQLANQRMKLSALYRDLEKENRDVEELGKMSFSSLLTRMTGQMASRMEKEVQEAKIMELRYNDAKRIENELLAELDTLKSERQTLTSSKEEYRQALADKCDQLNPEQASEMERMQKELGDCQSVIKETDEALDAGEDAKEIVDKALRALNSAQNWGVVDMIGALDFIADIAKHQKINEAKQLMDELQYALRRFKTELVDVRFDTSFQVNISSFDTMLDFFFDNMFFDFMVQSKINEAKNQVDRIYGQIESIMDELDQLRQRTINNSDLVRDKIRKLIEES